ncbi:glycosyltransferase family 4 protein [Gluconobacter morbifer]|uniref:Lipopolysaccharide core biosynthesis mannosyltransferase n=1 Tax=Gluconobacter morbifer G707 TaxID=1088869 RepID=G6XHW9_9PROT|nr:glycosyltransferase family 4 protein [Gluconobacter morbifer]EHH68343.1 lipopolysaccharide core biosynthesis mannosyltransferase [Gluconobacter morbifer G707]
MTERRVLVWQLGRRGAGPRIAVDLSDGIRSLGLFEVMLVLSDQAEILRSRTAPRDVLKLPTYRSVAGLVLRLMSAPWIMVRLNHLTNVLRPEMAIGAMPGPLDLFMMAALQRTGTKTAIIIHDAQRHPGDGYPFQMMLQTALIQKADLLVTFSQHVATHLKNDPAARNKPILALSHPPFIGTPSPAPFRHGGIPRLLMLGRLLPYKGLDLLAEALPRLSLPFTCRIIGQGPASPELARLANLPTVEVQNRWVPEDELPDLVGWADVIILPYREASQSGIGAMAIASGRYVVATNVGGLVEQFADVPQAKLCTPESSSLARTITDLLADPPRSQPAPQPEESWAELGRHILEKLASVS